MELESSELASLKLASSELEPSELTSSELGPLEPSSSELAPVELSSTDGSSSVFTGLIVSDTSDTPSPVTGWSSFARLTTPLIVRMS
ncbi:hypothetical protein, partial [Anaerotruncus massiliensis (ex Liu et al. 2021)]|uniref:hypothetical protein n=2 Tax=Anaerotruncus TaxID=244127 RepID=UPI003AB83BAB